MDQLHTVDEALFCKLLPYLSKERLEKVNRYRFFDDKVQSALAFVLLRIGLREEYSVSHIPEIAADDMKKPYFLNYPRIHFNLSHCKTGVACAINDTPVGIDIQHYAQYHENVARRMMTQKEFSVCNGNGAEFTRIWSLKESYGKYLGCGIQYDMAKHEVLDSSISRSYIFHDFVLSVSADAELKLVKIPSDEILARCHMLGKEYI